jgi:hypothetical protein
MPLEPEKYAVNYEVFSALYPATKEIDAQAGG